MGFSIGMESSCHLYNLYEALKSMQLIPCSAAFLKLFPVSWRVLLGAPQEL